MEEVGEFGPIFLSLNSVFTPEVSSREEKLSDNESCMMEVQTIAFPGTTLLSYNTLAFSGHCVSGGCYSF